VPFEEVAVGLVGSVIGQVDDLPGSGVKLIAVLEVLRSRGLTSSR